VARSQLSRLIELILVLQRGRCVNAREMAERCGVSRRTIYRDLDALTLAGVPIRYRKDKQGYSLIGDFAFDPATGAEVEAEALAIAVAGRPNVGFARMDDARRGAARFVQALPPEPRQRMATLAEALVGLAGVGNPSADSAALHATLLQALKERRQVRLWCWDEAGHDTVSTKLSPYRLVFADDGWAAIGRSSLHREVWTAWLPRVRKAVLTDDHFTIPPRFSLERYLGHAWRVTRGKTRQEVWVRFSTRVAPEIVARVWHRSQLIEALPDGRVDLHASLDGLDEFLDWLFRFGDQVEVVAPEELRKRYVETARRMIRNHAPVGPLEPAWN
jgi:predicted DNA-binding transcriptional regulator YafY